MAAALKPLTLWGHIAAPNPYKVVTVLEALSLPYTINNLDFSEVKTESYLALTPNGRLPTVEDPNTGLTLWESGAIIEYLVEHYDKDNKISFPQLPEKYLAKQWLAFQISGQGPYFGQATWFARFHPEQLPSAITRYTSEIHRVIGVLELGLSRNKTGWLVGDKCTYADLSFVTWAAVGEGLLKQRGEWEGVEAKNPKYAAWMKALGEREEVVKVRQMMAEGRTKMGLSQ